jgi:N-acetyl-alpha-D-muramate 1-phosphate uridylyltransferase
MQAIIVAGGLGTRLRPLTSSVPKAMVPVCGRPFLEYELTLLANSGIEDVVLCIGYLGEQVVDHFGDGSSSGIRIRYSWDGEELLGPIGAVKKAEALLADAFFLTYGDAYLRLDYGALMHSLLGSDKLSAMAVLRNENKHGRSDLVVTDGLVRSYDKQHTRHEMEWINFGVSALRREALRLVTPRQFCDEETFYGKLIGRGQLMAFEVYDRFYEVGSSAGLGDFSDFIASQPFSRA